MQSSRSINLIMKKKWTSSLHNEEMNDIHFFYVDDLIANGIIINNYTPGLLRMNNGACGTLSICISIIEPLIIGFNCLYNTLNMPHCSSCILNSPGVTFLKDPLSLRCQIKLWTWDEDSFFFSRSNNLSFYVL